MWFRATIPSTQQKDACPVKFEAVPGKNDTYHLFSEFGDSEYQHYLGIDPKDRGFVSANKAYTPSNGAMSVKLTKVGDPKTSTKYTMTDVDTGKYISYCDGSCSGGKWLLADYTQSEAMVVDLVPSGAVPSTDWGYCVSGTGVPEQINVQIAGLSSPKALRIKQQKSDPKIGLSHQQVPPA